MKYYSKEEGFAFPYNQKRIDANVTLFKVEAESHNNINGYRKKYYNKVFPSKKKNHYCSPKDKCRLEYYDNLLDSLRFSVAEQGYSLINNTKLIYVNEEK